MSVHLALVVPQLGIRHRANITIILPGQTRVVRRQDGRSGANNRADFFIKGLLLRFGDDLLERGAGLGVVGGGLRDARVFGEVVVVVGGGVGDGAGLALLGEVDGGVGGLVCVLLAVGVVVVVVRQGVGWFWMG